MKALTLKQRAVAELLAAGECDKQIADKLRLSMGGVRRHIGACMAKYGIRSRAGVAAAFERGKTSNNPDATFSAPTPKARKAV